MCIDTRNVLIYERIITECAQTKERQIIALPTYTQQTSTNE